MNPNDPEQPSLLKPDTSGQPAAAFTSGMPDPFARQAAAVDETKQNSNFLEADQPNSVAAKTLGGYNKSQENIYRIDSPSDGNGQPPAASEPNFPPANFGETTPPAAPMSPATPTAPAPNSAAPNATSASDYLNQIAPQKSGFGGKFLSKKILIIGGILTIALIGTIIAVAVTNNANQGPKETAVAAGTELANLQTLVSYGKSNAKSSANVKSTAETNLITLTQQYSLGQLFTLTDEKNKPAAPEFIADLDSAKANSNIETVYTETLAGQLNATYIALNSLEQQTSATNEKEALTQAKADIAELYRRITE